MGGGWDERERGERGRHEYVGHDCGRLETKPAERMQGALAGNGRLVLVLFWQLERRLRLSPFRADARIRQVSPPLLSGISVAGGVETIAREIERRGK